MSHTTVTVTENSKIPTQRTALKMRPCPPWCGQPEGHLWDDLEEGVPSRFHSYETDNGEGEIWAVERSTGEQTNPMIHFEILDVTATEARGAAAEIVRLADLSESCYRAPTISGVITLEMTAQGVSVRQLAAAADVALPTLQRFLTGHTDQINLDEIANVATALNKSLSAVVAAAEAMRA